MISLLLCMKDSCIFVLFMHFWLWGCLNLLEFAPILEYIHSMMWMRFCSLWHWTCLHTHRTYTYVSKKHLTNRRRALEFIRINMQCLVSAPDPFHLCTQKGRRKRSGSLAQKTWMLAAGFTSGCCQNMLIRVRPNLHWTLERAALSFT